MSKAPTGEGPRRKGLERDVPMPPWPAMLSYVRTAMLVISIAAVSLPSVASSTGPFLGANGIPGGTTCDTAGCHTTPPADADQGSVQILGLPAEWTPDATYSLRVVVQRPTARRFGFQLSAIFSNGRQAGTLSTTDPRISIVSGFSLTTPYIGQYAQHNDAPFGTAQWTFSVSWRAPSSNLSGDVTFYVAGNAANGNMANSGDAIYLINRRVPAAAVMLNSHAYSIANLGGVSLKTDGAGSSVGVGYAAMVADAGATAPSGIAIFGFRSSNVLVSETSVPAATVIRSGRIFAEVGPGAALNTGIAIANPNPQPATISFFLTNALGIDSPVGVANVPANGQIAKFLNEAPFNSGTNIQGTFTFSSDIPVSMIALRGYTNERSEFLLTTLPVIDLAGAVPAGIQILPHYADGGGWITEIVLINSTDSASSGTIDFYNPGDASGPGSLVNRIPYSIAQRSARKVSTAGTATTTSSGSVRIVPDPGTASPVALLVFSFRPAGITIATAGVPALQGTAFRMYAESSGAPGSTGSIQTGVAIANASSTSVTVNLELSRLDGTSAATAATLTIPGSGQVAKFLNELFPGPPASVQGVLRVTSQSAALSVVGLRSRYNERNDFLITTTPPSLESPPTTEIPTLFPHIVNGGGYTTQFILYSGRASQTGTGVIRLFQQDGSSFNLPLN
jgi:hypothetical protein